MTKTLRYSTILYGGNCTKKYGGFLIAQIDRLSARIWERLLKECGVDAFNGAQGRILYVLWEHKDVTITDIARLTSLAKTTLTSMLDRMEAAGLVERIPDTNNRRQIFVSLTKKSRKYREKYDKLSGDMNTIFYEGFKESEITDFENKLRSVLKNLQKKE